MLILGAISRSQTGSLRRYSDMKKVEFKLDIGGLRELMKSGEMQAALDEAG